MYCILSNKEIDDINIKTNALLRIAHDILYKVNNEDDNFNNEYALILFFSGYENYKNKYFGKDSTVNQDIIDKINIKLLSNYEELEQFICLLLLMDKSKIPKYLFIDRVNLFFPISKDNFRSSNIYMEKLLISYMNFYRNLSNLCQETNITIVISQDENLYYLDQIINNNRNQNYYQNNNDSAFEIKGLSAIFNSLLNYSEGIYIITKSSKKVNCSKMLFKQTLSSNSNSKWSFIHVKEENMAKTSNINSNLIEESLIHFENIMNEFLKDTMDEEK